MKKALFLLSLLLPAGACLALDDDFQWKKLSPDQAHFSIEMPDISGVIHAEGGHSWSVADRKTHLGFLITVTDIGEALPNDTETARKALELSAKGSLKPLSGKMLDKRFLVYQGIPAIEIKAQTVQKGKIGLVIERMMVVGTHSYVLFYLAPPSQYHPVQAERFFNSLRIL